MNARDALFLGVDGGGTATRAVVVDGGGTVRGRGMASGGANQAMIGRDAALAAVRAAIHAALAEAGAAEVGASGGRPVRAAWIGLAGVDAPADAYALRPMLAPLADHLRVSNDAELPLGALPGGVGMVVIAGTGSIALGRNAAGQMARAGGWGQIFGDEGSGYAIGAAALRAVAHAADGRGEPTALTATVLRALDVATPPALIARVHQDCNKADIAGLTPLVVAAAADGDGVAGEILRRAAGELADQARAVVRALNLAAPLPLALGGGLLLAAPAYRTLVLDALGSSLPGGREWSRPYIPRDEGVLEPIGASGGRPAHGMLPARDEDRTDEAATIVAGWPAFAPLALVRDAALVAARSVAAEVAG